MHTVIEFLKSLLKTTIITHFLIGVNPGVFCTRDHLLCTHLVDEELGDPWTSDVYQGYGVSIEGVADRKWMAGVHPL